MGFIGGNERGKTTTMRMMMGVLSMMAGEVRWRGRPITQEDRRGFGYMPEERGLYPKQPILDQLVYLGRLRGLPAAGAHHRHRPPRTPRSRHRAKDHVEKLSLGNQQRVQIIAALMGRPQALILDEPFSGLDPKAVDTMADLLREHGTRCPRPLLVPPAGARRAPLRAARHPQPGPGRGGGPTPATSSRASSGCAPPSWPATRRGSRRSRASMPSRWTGRPPSSRSSSRAPERQLLTLAAERGGVVEFAVDRPTLAQIYREVTA